MQSTAEDVTAYLKEAPLERVECLTKIRASCLKHLIDYNEGMEYGMPCYSKNGAVEVAFASQKNYISLYILKTEVVNAHRELLQGLNVGKSCIKYTKPEKVDFGVVEKLLKSTYKSDTPVC